MNHQSVIAALFFITIFVYFRILLIISRVITLPLPFPSTNQTGNTDRGSQNRLQHAGRLEWRRRFGAVGALGRRQPAAHAPLRHGGAAARARQQAAPPAGAAAGGWRRRLRVAAALVAQSSSPSHQQPPAAAGAAVGARAGRATSKRSANGASSTSSTRQSQCVRG